MFGHSLLLLGYDDGDNNNDDIFISRNIRYRHEQRYKRELHQRIDIWPDLGVVEPFSRCKVHRDLQASQRTDHNTCGNW